MYAFIYARWSSLEQGKGTTLTRQLEVCREYCKARGWVIAGELRDEGRSA